MAHKLRPKLDLLFHVFLTRPLHVPPEHGSELLAECLDLVVSEHDGIGRPWENVLLEGLRREPHDVTLQLLQHLVLSYLNYLGRLSRVRYGLDSRVGDRGSCIC